MSIKLENGKKIIISAPGVRHADRYVPERRTQRQAVHPQLFVALRHQGRRNARLCRRPNPSQWGTGENDVPTSITQGSAKPTPLVSLLPTAGYDVTASTATNVGRVFDRNSDTEWSSPAGTAPSIEAVQARKNQRCGQALYAHVRSKCRSDSAGWTLKGSNDGAAGNARRAQGSGLHLAPADAALRYQGCKSLFRYRLNLPEQPPLPYRNSNCWPSR